MKVKILKTNKQVPGKVGEVVECDEKIGNPLSCLGIVKVVEHDKPWSSQPKAMIVKDEKSLKVKAQKEGGE